MRCLRSITQLAANRRNNKLLQFLNIIHHIGGVVLCVGYFISGLIRALILGND